MPFKSKKQWRKCFAMKAKGKAKGWNCREWAHETESYKDLPKKVAAILASYLLKTGSYIPFNELMKKNNKTVLPARPVEINDPFDLASQKKKDTRRSQNVRNMTGKTLDRAARKGTTKGTSLKMPTNVGKFKIPNKPVTDPKGGYQYNPKVGL